MERLSHRFAYLGGAAILFCAGMVVVDVVLRALGIRTTLRSFEISTYVFAIATAFGFAHALFERKHVRIDVLYALFPARVRVVFDFIGLAALGLLAATVAYQAAQTALDSYEIGATSPSTLRAPLYVPQGMWALGLAWFALCCAYLFLRCVAEVLRGRWRNVARLVGLAPEKPDV